MNKVALTALGGGVIGLLSACGSTTTGVISPASSAQFLSSSSGIVATYDDVADTVTISAADPITNPAAPLVISNVGPWLGSNKPGNFDYYYSFGVTPLSAVMRANSISGEGGAVAYIWGGQEFGAQYFRVVDSSIPTSGTGTYSGFYAGLYGGGQAATSIAHPTWIEGRVELDVDFTAAEISGLISDRTDGGDQYHDVILETTTVTDGGFTGTTTGGVVDILLSSTVTVKDGSYGGMIVGPDGSEIVGSFVLTHVYTPTLDEFTEIGVFTAN